MLCLPVVLWSTHFYFILLLTKAAFECRHLQMFMGNCQQSSPAWEFRERRWVVTQQKIRTNTQTQPTYSQSPAADVGMFGCLGSMQEPTTLFDPHTVHRDNVGGKSLIYSCKDICSSWCSQQVTDVCTHAHSGLNLLRPDIMKHIITSMDAETQRSCIKPDYPNYTHTHRWVRIYAKTH